MYIWLETTSGTVQKWSLRPLLDSLKGGLNIGILLYFMYINWLKEVTATNFLHGDNNFLKYEHF